MRQITDVKHPHEVAVARNLHVILQPASDVVRVATDDETILPHLLKRRVRPGKITLNPLAMLEGAVSMESRYGRRVVHRTREDAEEVGHRLFSLLDGLLISFRHVE